MAHDAGIGEQGRHLGGIVARDLFGVETVEGGAKGGALAQDRDPRQSRLEPVEHELLEQGAVVPFGNAPFLIVIGEIERVGPGPATAREPVSVDDGPASRRMRAFSHAAS